MSTDCTAKIFYGFPLPSLKVDEHDLNEEWEKLYLPKKPEDRSDYRTPEWDEWRRKLSEWEATTDNVKIDWSGAEGCEQYYIHCPCYEVEVEWGELKPVPINMAVNSNVAARLHEFCDRFNLPKREPGWYLSARYF